MPHYNVHLYPIVRVKVTGVEAPNPIDAIAAAERHVDFDQIFNYGGDMPIDKSVEDVEYADDTDLHAFVDVAGDTEHEQSQSFDWDINHQRWVPADRAYDRGTLHAVYGAAKELLDLTESEKFQNIGVPWGKHKTQEGQELALAMLKLRGAVRGPDIPDPPVTDDPIVKAFEKELKRP